MNACIPVCLLQLRLSCRRSIRYDSTMSNSSHHLSLLRPSIEVPWAVDAVSAIPESIVASTTEPQSPPLAAISHGRWHCIATLQETASITSPTRKKNASAFKTPVILSVWYNHPKDSLTEQKHKPNAVLQLHHEKLYSIADSRLDEASQGSGSEDVSSKTKTTAASSSSSPPAILLGMVSSSNKSLGVDSVYLYAVHPTTGYVWMWKLATTDFIKPFVPSCCASCRIPLEIQDKLLVGGDGPANDSTTMQDGVDQDDEYVSAFSVAWPKESPTLYGAGAVTAPMILAGTSRGATYWMTQCLAPMSLEATLVVDSSAAPSSKRQSIFGYFSSAMTSAATAVAAFSSDSSSSQPIVSILVVSPMRFLVYNAKAQSTDWTVTRTDTNYRILFHRQRQTASMDWSKVLATPAAASASDSDESMADATDDAIVRVELKTASLMTVSATDDEECNDVSGKNATTTSHLILLTHHEHAFEATSTRLQWVVVENDPDTKGESSFKILEHHVLDRFSDPSSVTCRMAPTAHGGCYAVMQSASALSNTSDLQQPPPVTVFLCHYQNQVLELDLSVMQDRQQLLVADHRQLVGRVWSVSGQDEGAAVCGGGGMYIVTNQGLGLVVRRILPAPASPGKRASSALRRVPTTPGAPAMSVNQLAVHLKSQFLQYYHHQATAAAMVPPSLKRASLQDLQSAVIQVAAQQTENASANHLDAHHALLEFLQESGLYHRLSALCRHVLLTLGQQIAAYRAIKACKPATSWEHEQLVRLAAPEEILDWLESTQRRVLAPEEGSDRRETYLEWLCMALREASSYVMENRAYKYDLLTLAENCAVDSEDDLPSWTTQLPMLLKQLFDFWKGNGPATLQAAAMQVVIPSAMEAFQELFNWSQTAAVKDQYADAQVKGVRLLRLAKFDDELVRDICVEYRYFGGLCEISHDHEGKSDSTRFALDNFFVSLASKRDLSTDLLFPLFALKWHTDRNLLGHVFNYGKQCPDALSQLIMDEEKLRPYRWIHSTRIGDYNGATEALVQSVDRQMSTVNEANISLGHAKLINSIVEKDSSFLKQTATKRREMIDKKRELVNAQELLADAGNGAPQRLLSPHQLLDLATRRFEGANTLDDKVQVCCTGLAICASLENPADCTKLAASVWIRAIGDDHLLWKELVSKEANLSGPAVRELIHDETVFGGLVECCANAGTAWDNVRFGAVMETEVMGKLDIQDSQLKFELSRLLHNATMKQ